MKKGIKLFEDAGVGAVLKELQQLHDRKVLEPKNAKSLSPSERKAALHYLMFLKEKQTILLKGEDAWMAARSATTSIRRTPAHQPLLWNP